MKKLWRSLYQGRRKWAVRILAAFALYSLLGFLVVPAVLKAQLVKRLPGLTKRHAEVRQVRMNPWTLSLTIRGLKLSEPNGDVFASWDELYVNFQASSLLRWAWTFKEIRLDRPYGAVILNRDGKFNFANMFPDSPKPAPTPEPPAKGGIPRLRVFQLSITNGFIALQDKTRRSPFRTEYRPINVLVTRLTTQPGTATPYSFRAENDSGQSLTWKGDVAVEPFTSHGSIEIIGADPSRYQPYLEDFTKAKVTGGKADLRADYWFAAGTNGIDLTVTNAGFRSIDFELQDPAANESVLKVPLFAIDGARLDLRTRTGGAKRVTIEKADVVARRERDGSINFSNLLLPRPKNAAPNSVPDAPRSPPTTPSPAWTIAVDEFHMQEAGVKFQDLANASPFETQLRPIELALTNFTTAPEKDAQFSFSINTEAAEAISGGGTVSMNPPRSAGELKLAAVRLPKYWPYAEAVLRGGIQEGQLDVTVPFQVALGTNNTPQASVSNALVQVTNLRVRGPASEETLLALPSLAIEGAGAKLGDRTAGITRVKIQGGSLLARRGADGSINLLSILAPGPATNAAPREADSPKDPAPAPDSTPERTTAWTAKVDEVDLSDYSLTVEDQAVSNAAPLKLDGLALNLKGISTVTTQPVTVAFSTRLNETGNVAARGQVRAEPARANLELTVTNLDLRPLQPYLDQRLNLTLAEGAFSMRGTAEYQANGTNPPPLRFSGDIEIARFRANDQLTFQEFVRWKGLRIGGIDFSMNPDKLDVNEIAWDGLKTTVLVSTNQQINLLTVVPGQTPDAAAAQTVPGTDAQPTAVPAKDAGQSSTPKTGSPAPFPITVKTFAITDGSLHFGDASIQPNCAFDVKQFNGTIRGLSSDPDATATVDFRGNIDDQAPFAVSGRINPLSPTLKVDLAISNSNIQLPAFTPYMEKFAGHPLNRGRISLDLRYEINDQDLKAANKFRIDQLTLGPRNNSPDATKLPVKLAVALLKDRHGVIDMDIPVSGRLNDPQFRVGKIILQVLVNVMTKAATSPFKLLGAIVGGGEELSFVEFVPGTVTLMESETNKVEKLLRALAERPAINLEIEGFVDPYRDRDALARDIVRANLKTARLKELAATGQHPDGSTFELEPVHEQRLLRAALVREFGTNLTSALKEFSAAQAATNATAATNRQALLAAQAPARKGLLARVINWLPIHGKNSPTGAARRQAKADAALLKQNPELASVAGEDMEGLLAQRTEVPPEQLLGLIKDRTQAIQKMLTEGGTLAADRVFLIAPKPQDTSKPGLARATLSLN